MLCGSVRHSVRGGIVLVVVEVEVEVEEVLVELDVVIVVVLKGIFPCSPPERAKETRVTSIKHAPKYKEGLSPMPFVIVWPCLFKKR
jgi:hypothetical protein